MGGRHLSRQNELQAGVKCVGDLRSILDSRICENQYSSVRFLRRDQFPRFHEKRTYLFIPPQCGHSARPRLNRNDLRQIFPQWRSVLFLEPLVEFAEFVGSFWLLIEARRIHQAVRTFTSMLPIFSIVATTVSPGCIGLTPSGVPVKMTSPGFNV